MQPVTEIGYYQQLAYNLDNFKKTMINLDKDVRLLVDGDMYISDNSVRTAAGQAIKAIYTDGSFEDNLAAGVQFYSDNRFIRAIIKYAELQAQYTDVYFYQFSYHGALGGNDVYVKLCLNFFVKISIFKQGCGRVAHAEDTRYIWAAQSGTDLGQYSAADVTTLDRYVTLFTNFAKTLNPTPEQSELLQNIIWPKVSANNFNYLDIDENLEIKQNPREFSYQKWVEVYETYATKPFISF
ncbi:hypothetical protein NQ318_007280 [Aromia moschata]|uniref:Carboxylesterase type B domain-containing protein n=1 Tax=Aromia moschata TaxID=1265417 RepID=A0AAV8Z182_9CUCU|nr:hypothetical protein NQ318_007280 [Aromia moschata]